MTTSLAATCADLSRWLQSMQVLHETPLDCRPQRCVPQGGMGMFALLSVVATSSALAQQPVRPLPKVGGCPVGYYASGDYCVPSKSGNSRGAIEKVGNGCPVGFYASGHYCLSSPSNQREAMEKQGNSCPMGWFSSGRYCVKTR
jgi:hypothetical protein